MNITGVVVDSSGSPVQNAQVSIGGQNSVVNTDGKGDFTITFVGSPNTAIALLAQSPNHARSIRPYTVPRIQTEPVVLRIRALDYSSTVQIPAAGEPPVVVTVPGADGGTSLTIPPGSLVGPDGSVATGPVDVRLTAWLPNDALDTAPGILYAQETNNAITRLETFGMADIEVSQNGNLLQVAQGQNLVLSMGASTAQRPALAAGQGLPHLYSLNPNTGYWNDEGDFASGKLGYDPNAAMFTAYLPHLSSWNIDTGIPTSAGGCVIGQVKNICDPNMVIGAVQADVWFLDWEQTARFPVTTDAQGNFCAQTGTPTLLGDITTVTHYLVTGSDGTTSSQCDPRPAACKQCYDSSSSYCNDCRFESNYDGAARGSTVVYYGDVCQPATPTVDISACTFCPGQTPSACTSPGSGGAVKGNACATLQTTYIPGPNCHCDANGKCNVCTASQGMSCDDTHPCCSNADGTPNVCIDFLCVPPTDPTVTQ